MDLNNLANMAQQAGNLASNPMAQQILNNPAVSGILNQVEDTLNMDLNGNGSIGADAQAQDQIETAQETAATQE
jgi:hypothetical protein